MILYLCIKSGQALKKLFTMPRMKELLLWIAGFFIMKEIWKDIEGYEGRYQVSNYGRAKSLIGNEKILKPGRGSGRNFKYRTIRLYKDTVGITKTLHRIVAKTFIPNPENKPQINHKDANPSNNCVTNLEWCTGFENMKHADEMGLIPRVCGESHPNSKLSDNGVSHILKKLSDGFSTYQIAAEYNVTQSIISDINLGVAWKHIPR